MQLCIFLSMSYHFASPKKCVIMCLRGQCGGQLACGSQRAALWTWFFPSAITWVLGLELGSISMIGQQMPLSTEPHHQLFFVMQYYYLEVIFLQCFLVPLSANWYSKTNMQALLGLTGGGGPLLCLLMWREASLLVWAILWLICSFPDSGTYTSIPLGQDLMSDHAPHIVFQRL